MEKQESDKERKEVIKIRSSNGNNIGGLVLWGGVLVVTSLTASFIAKKRRGNGVCGRDVRTNKQGQKEDDQDCKRNEGVDLARETPPQSITQQNLSCRSSSSSKIVGNKSDQRELYYDKTSLGEDKVTQATKGGNDNAGGREQDIVLVGDSEPEVESGESGEEISLLAPHLEATSLCEMGNKIQHDHASPLIEMIGEGICEKLCYSEEDNLSAHSVGESEEVDSSENYGEEIIKGEDKTSTDDSCLLEVESNQDSVLETGEGSFKETGTPSPESTHSAIWPAELVQAVATELKNTMSNQQSSAEETLFEDDTTAAKTKNHDHTSSRSKALETIEIPEETVSAEFQWTATNQQYFSEDTVNHAILTGQEASRKRSVDEDMGSAAGTKDLGEKKEDNVITTAPNNTSISQEGLGKETVDEDKASAAKTEDSGEESGDHAISTELDNSPMTQELLGNETIDENKVTAAETEDCDHINREEPAELENNLKCGQVLEEETADENHATGVKSEISNNTYNSNNDTLLKYNAFYKKAFEDLMLAMGLGDRITKSRIQVYFMLLLLLLVLLLFYAS